MALTAIITKLADLYAARDLAMAASYLSCDTETSGLKQDDVVVCIAFAYGPNDSFCIPIKIWQDGALVIPWSTKAYPMVLEVIAELLSHPKQLYHNAVFDARMIKHSFGIQIIDRVFCDTQLLHHTAIDENPPHGLKENAAKYLDPNAAAPQDDLKASSIANGGRWVAGQKDMYMGDWKLLAEYNCWDVLYTYRLFELWYPEIEKQGLQDLWNLEVMPLMKVTYEMNTTGIKVDLPYFEKLKTDMEVRIEALEDEIYASARDKIYQYEIGLLKEKLLLSKASGPGKMLLAAGLPMEWNDTTEPVLYQWHLKHKKLKRVFNIDSANDKAFLLYDVLELPVTVMTDSGKRSTNRAVIDSLIEKFEGNSVLLTLIKERGKELKLLNTYVEPILETHEGGIIYPSFMQTGTTSGRFSCGGRSINMQTLPRDDHRIKAGFVPQEGYAFIAADYASLEPRIFAEVSGAPGIKRIFSEGLDFYSTIAIDVLGLKDVSANPLDANYLGKVDKAKRQEFKAIVLAVPYGAEGGRISQLLKVSYDEGKELVAKYLKTYPELKAWMDRMVWDMKTKGYVTSRAGRKKRGQLIYDLYNKYRLKDFSKRSLQDFWCRNEWLHEEFKEDKHFSLEVRNLLNVSRNHVIQSLAGSVMNTAMIDVYRRLKDAGMETKLVANTHDEACMIAPLHEVDQAAKILQECMEHNRITDKISVVMLAEPVITTVNLSKAK
jgi:DNA polymerase I-like protein with 3'-5' exonuclease and polymerase domains